MFDSSQEANTNRILNPPTWAK